MCVASPTTTSRRDRRIRGAWWFVAPLPSASPRDRWAGRYGAPRNARATGARGRSVALEAEHAGRRGQGTEVTARIADQLSGLEIEQANDAGDLGDRRTVG